MSAVDRYSHYQDLKQKTLERVLGPMHGIVGHATIPFSIGGAVDLYYFPHVIPGTAFVTMELIQPDGKGPLPSGGRTYELIAFSRESLVPKRTRRFAAMERRIGSLFTTVGRYSFESSLNPGETCEVPVSGGTGHRCLVLDEFSVSGRPFIIGKRRHMLLLCIEVFRREMEYAREHGGQRLVTLLKRRNVYPYSDLDRDAVV